MTIVVKQLYFNYGKKAALKGVSFSLSAGFNVLLGPNGAGKSTLFSLLTGLYQPSSGEIIINGYDLLKSKLAIMRNVGVVFQQATLDLDLSIRQNLLYHASLHGIAPNQALHNIERILTQLKLQTRLDDKVRSLNGGHRRRVEIARALIHQPKVLLLDEATVGLDTESRALIIEHVRDLCQQLDICVLWTTHLMDEVTAQDQLIIINEGEVQAQGVTSDLCQTHQVENVYQLYYALTHHKGLV